MEIKSELMLRGSTAGPRQGELALRGWNGSGTPCREKMVSFADASTGSPNLIFEPSKSTP